MIFLNLASPKPLTESRAGFNTGSISTAYHPLAFRDEGNEFGGDGAADIGQDGYARNGKPYRDQRFRHTASDEKTCNRREEEHMHKIHSEGQFRKTGNELRSGLAPDAGEEQKGPE